VLIGKELSSKQQNIFFRHNWCLWYYRERLMFFRYLSFFILGTFLVAQDETRPTVAILDFEGQDISVQEVQTLTERMRTEIGNTNAVRLIERKAIESIMAEQGLAQSGCVTDECAAEVGQLLGVQFMINGSIGKIGDSFTIDVKMFSVETGATERSAVTTGDIFLEDLKVSIYGGIPYNEEFTGTAQQNLKLFSIDPSLRGTKKAVRKEAWDGMRKPAVPGYISDNFGLVDTLIGKVVTYSNVTHEGDIEGLLVEMQILAWEIVGLEAPPALKLKRAGASEKQTVAVLDFEGRGITIMEAQTLTDRFMTAMANTDRVQLVDRATMWDVLSEQGYTATECTSDECAAEVGAILGVELMVNGSIGKIGNTYTIDAKMFSVATGATERSKNVTHEGDIEGLLVEMQILAWEIVGLEAPTTQAISETLTLTDSVAKAVATTQAISETLTLTDTTTKAASTTQAISETLTLTDTTTKAASTTQAISETLTLTDTTTKAASTSQAPKTQVGALVRGIAFPGLGHLYSNEKKWGYIWMGTEAVMGALIYSTYSAHQSATTDWNNYQQLYLNERDIALLLEHKQNRNNSMTDIEAANGQLALLAGIASSVWIANVVHAYMVGPGSEKKKLEKQKKEPEEAEPAVEEQALSRVDIKLAYDPALQQTQLKFSIPLH
jgi:TolB-like protein